MTQPVPTYALAQLAAVYADDPAAASARFGALAAAFTQAFGAPPDFYVRSPGTEEAACARGSLTRSACAQDA